MEQILIVEDDSFLNKMLDYNLTADGYGVTSALNARTAAEAIRQREFDLVLLDITHVRRGAGRHGEGPPGRRHPGGLRPGAGERHRVRQHGSHRRPARRQRGRLPVLPGSGAGPGPGERDGAHPGPEKGLPLNERGPQQGQGPCWGEDERRHE